MNALSPSGGRRGPVVALAAAAAVVLVLLVVVLTRGGDDGGTAPAAGPSGAASDGSTGVTAGPDDPGATSGPGGSGDSGDSDSGSDSDGGGSTGPGDASTPRAQRTVRVPLAAPARASRVVTVRATRLEWVEGQSRVRGEVGGPSLRVTLVATNRSQRPVDIGTALVNAYYGPDDRPASPQSGPGGRPFPATLRPDGSATGRFVFAMPQRGQVPVRLEVVLDDRLAVVDFVGRPASVM